MSKVIEQIVRLTIDGDETKAEVIGEAPKWIPVTERLPELDERVMMAGKRGSVFIGRRWGETLAISDGTYRGFTHWMPLPEAPNT